jgi:hypothetical protein
MLKAGTGIEVRPSQAWNLWQKTLGGRWDITLRGRSRIFRSHTRPQGPTSQTRMLADSSCPPSACRNGFWTRSSRSLVLSLRTVHDGLFQNTALSDARLLRTRQRFPRPEPSRRRKRDVFLGARVTAAIQADRLVFSAGSFLRDFSAMMTPADGGRSRNGLLNGAERTPVASRRQTPGDLASCRDAPHV